MSETITVSPFIIAGDKQIDIRTVIDSFPVGHRFNAKDIMQNLAVDGIDALNIIAAMTYFSWIHWHREGGYIFEGKYDPKDLVGVQRPGDITNTAIVPRSHYEEFGTANGWEIIHEYQLDPNLAE